jgi:sterol desaturase/sphingolipid hydroxylase (fatty acid hydroxylase superfamily)
MYVYDQHRLFDLDPTNPMVWAAIFLCRDFVYYWIHRAEHQLKVLWASHMVHHSSEEFSFTTAVRMPWMEALYKPALGLWAPLLGFHPLAFAAMGALVLIVGQFQHTELLRRRSPLDAVFVMPSAHRVHHGSNPEYLDKNFGSMLIIWDRVFGTYEPEKAPVTYGLTGGVRVRTPSEALVGGYRELANDVRSLSGRATVRQLVARP